MNTASHPRLLGDIGGTNARFAWQDAPDAPAIDVANYGCAEHPTLLDAIRCYLSDHAKPVPYGCAIGIANPITGDTVQMTNHHWSFSITELQHHLGVARIAVINDFTALALALPSLKQHELRQIGAGSVVTGAPLAVLGAGTGLGVSGLLPRAGGGFVPIEGEGGHVTLAATDAYEAEVLARLRDHFGHVSAERVLSGPGLVNLHRAVCEVAGHPAEVLTAPDILARAAAASDRRCVDTRVLFCAFLGSVAGNLALTLGSRGGVYIGGGIAPRMLDALDASDFRARFEGKGRFQSYLQAIPTFVIDTATSPALLGAARALDEASH